jgi:hypothetical protein
MQRTRALLAVLLLFACLPAAGGRATTARSLTAVPPPPPPPPPPLPPRPPPPPPPPSPVGFESVQGVVGAYRLGTCTLGWAYFELQASPSRGKHTPLHTRTFSFNAHKT